MISLELVYGRLVAGVRSFVGIVSQDGAPHPIAGGATPIR